MIRFKIALFFFSCFNFLNAQPNTIKETESETIALALELYKSESASWQSTDLLLEQHKNLLASVKGYISYNEGEVTKSIYYGGNHEKVFFQVTFKDLLKFRNLYEIDTVVREITPFEKRLISVRELARMNMSQNVGDIFTTYQKTSINFVPVAFEDRLFVFAFTAPKETGVVLLGNDYVFRFDEKDALLEVNKMHNSLLQFKVDAETTYHSHVLDEYPLMTATDLCTLMLYAPYISWKSHIVFSEDYVSLWNKDKEGFLVLTKAAWEKINTTDKSNEN
ncbi:hypothetical protein ACJD0Z_07425 [Flavobacteriaceae bacterium M23B6Z8]